MFGTRSASLDRDRVSVPLSPFAPEVRRLADFVERPGERLPLMIGSYVDGAFRAVDAMWIDGSDSSSVRSLAQLRGLLAGLPAGMAGYPTLASGRRGKGGPRPGAGSRLGSVTLHAPRPSGWRGNWRPRASVSSASCGASCSAWSPTLAT